MNHKAAFAKTDLVVILCLVVFLLAGLGAVGAGGRRHAKQMVCLSNLHQWGVIWKMFTDDNKGYFAERLDWIWLLRPYYGNKLEVFLCPMASNVKEDALPWPYDVTGGKFDPWRATYTDVEPWLTVKASYGYNQWCTFEPRGTIRGDWAWGALPVFAIKGAANVPLLVDCALPVLAPWHHDEPPEWDGQIYYSKPINVNEIRSCCFNRHDGGINGVFCDWSARKIGLKELWELHWHRCWYNWECAEPPNYAPPIWPEWMENFKDYARVQN